MKYNEAIDMILDGGIMYRLNWNNSHFIPEAKFRYREVFGKKVLYICGEFYSERACDMNYLETNHGDKEDWIVKKDGVVYDKKPSGIPLIICVASRTGTQDKPAEVEEGGESWEKIKMPIIADQVDEDWLEKKMLCFMRRHFLLKPNTLQFCKVCRDKECPFCFPGPKPDHTPDVSNMVDEPREKVTVEDILYLINGVVGAEIAETMAIFCPNYDEETRAKMRKGSSEALDLWGGKLKKKIEYLVSLQEK